jgi:putative phosphoesterase
MKVLLISDAHANLEALEEVLNHTNVDDIIFVGDAVDYGPNPVETFDLIRYTKTKRVLGNHDAAASFKIDCRSSPAMHRASVATREMITYKLMPSKSLDLLGRADRKLDLEYDGLKIRVVHAAPDDELYKYLSRDEAEKLDMGGADLMLLGHTHVAFEVKNDKAWVVNPGSVGMPADGDPRASYAILDTNTRHVTFGRVKYDVEGVISKLQDMLGQDSEVFEVLAGCLRKAHR